MRLRLLLSVFMLSALVSIKSVAQGCKVYVPYSVPTAFSTSLSAEEILKNAAVLDSIERAERLRFAPDDTVDGWRNWLTVENHAFGKNRGDIPMIVDPNSLHPYFRDKVVLLLQECKKKGIELAVVETYRTPTKQAEYKNMGKKYTSSGAGKSKHQYGLAIDVVPMVNGEAQWNNMTLWRKIGTTGERLGLRWGGRWKYPFDPGHFEWSSGLSGDDLANGLEPIVPNQQTSYPCLEEDLRQLKKFWTAIEAHQSLVVRK